MIDYRIIGVTKSEKSCDYGNKTKSLIGPIVFKILVFNVFVNLPRNSEEYQIKYPKLQSMMQ